MRTPSSIRRNISELTNRLRSLSVIKMADAEETPVKGFWVSKVPLEKQHMIDTVIDNITRLIDLNILYGYSSRDGRVVRVVAYATPYSDGLYSIHLESHQYGLLDFVYIVYYESMEIMLNNLRQERLSLNGLDVIISQQESLTSLLKKFVN